jgi:hypothetical protein
MKSVLPLTAPDRLSLEKHTGSQRKALLFFFGITLAGVVAVVIGFVITPQAPWPAIASIFVALFVLGTFISWREYKKIQTDLKIGLKEQLKGTIKRKQISQGGSKIVYDKGTLQRIAQRVEEEEAGRPVTRYGVIDMEIERATRLWYGVVIEKENVNIGIRHYLTVAEGDSIVIEIAPKSRRVFSVTKE